LTVENKSGIIPLEYFILVRLDTVDEITKGRIWIPPTTRDQMQQMQTSGVLTAIGPLAFRYDVKNGVIPEVGQRVMFAKYGGIIANGKDNAEYRLLKDGDLAAILIETIK
jgi:co-chaperonin GroES (HSP10)